MIEPRIPNPVYIELHAASAFSFLQGASLPETLVDRAAALGYPAIALLDADGVYGAPRFHKAAKQAGLKAIIGAELTIDSKSQVPSSKSQIPNHKSRIPNPGSRIPAPGVFPSSSKGSRATRTSVVSSRA